MIYWLFTDGRAILAGLLIPLTCGTLILPLMLSVAMGAGIQRSHDPQESSGWKRILKIVTHGVVLMTVTAIYLSLVGDKAIQRVRGRQDTSDFIRAVAGGADNIDHTRLFLFGVMLVFLWMIVSLVLHNGLKNGGWLRERTDRLRTPSVRRGALGSSHFCTPREYKRFRRVTAQAGTNGWPSKAEWRTWIPRCACLRAVER